MAQITEFLAQLARVVPKQTTVELNFTHCDAQVTKSMCEALRTNPINETFLDMVDLPPSRTPQSDIRYATVAFTKVKTEMQMVEAGWKNPYFDPHAKVKPMTEREELEIQMSLACRQHNYDELFRLEERLINLDQHGSESVQHMLPETQPVRVGSGKRALFKIVEVDETEQAEEETRSTSSQKTAVASDEEGPLSECEASVGHQEDWIIDASNLALYTGILRELPTKVGEFAIVNCATMTEEKFTVFCDILTHLGLCDDGQPTKDEDMRLTVVQDKKWGMKKGEPHLIKTTQRPVLVDVAHNTKSGQKRQAWQEEEVGTMGPPPQARATGGENAGSDLKPRLNLFHRKTAPSDIHKTLSQHSSTSSMTRLLPDAADGDEENW